MVMRYSNLTISLVYLATSVGDGEAIPKDFHVLSYYYAKLLHMYVTVIIRPNKKREIVESRCRIPDVIGTKKSLQSFPPDIHSHLY